MKHASLPSHPRASLSCRILAGTIAGLCMLAAPAPAAVNTWTDLAGSLSIALGPYWTNFGGGPPNPYDGNWSLGRVPVASDDVLFQLPFVRPAFNFSAISPTLAGLDAGRVVVLFDDPTLLPPALVANSLTFTANYTLVTAKDVINPYVGDIFDSKGLTLTSGDITVGKGTTATIAVPLIAGSGTITKLGPGTLLFYYKTITGNLLVKDGTMGGTYTVTGGLRNEATLRTTIASPDAHDLIQVGEKARLGGELEVSLLNSYQPRKGQKFSILTAGEVSGEFDDVDAPEWNGLTLHAFYEKHRVFLKVVIASFESVAQTPNQRAVAEELDKVAYDTRAEKLVSHLYRRDFDKLPGDFDRIAPEELTSAFAISNSLANVQSLNLQRRMDDLRQGSSGFSAGGLAMQGTGPGYSGSLFGAAGPTGKDVKESKDVPAPVEEKRWGAFLTGVGEWVDVGGDGNARGYDIATGGFTLGLDYKVCPNFAIGIAAGYAGTGADLTDNGRVFVNGGKLGIYATTFVGGWYADVAANGGYNSYDTRRTALQGTARGSTDGGELNVLAGTGYDWKLGGLTFGPTATFNYTYVGTNEFTEHGSLAPLDIHGGHSESLRTAFGVKASYDWKVGGILIRPEIRAAWQHEFGDAAYALDSSFASGAGDSFLVNGPKLGRDSALIGAGFAIQCSERISTYFYYDGEFGRTNYQSNNVSGGLRISF